MISLKNPNAWSCLPTAFAIALGASVEAVIATVGHDGSEITHAGLPEPMNRRGFHPQEMIKMCLQDGMSVTPIELAPQAIASRHMSSLSKAFDTGGWDWFKENLFSTTGVIECRTSVGTGHAMAYQGEGHFATIYDPATGKEFPFSDPEDTENRDRWLVSLWRLEEIQQ